MNDKLITPKLLELREKARILGIKFHHRAGEAKLEELIKFSVNGGNEVVKSEPAATPPPAVPHPTIPISTPPGMPKWHDNMLLSTDEYIAQTRKENRRDVGRLIRIKIQCMNPQKNKWEGEFISVGSSKMGTFKKFIPFNTGEPYHVPKMIYDYLVEKQCSSFYNATGPHGQKIKKR